MDDARAQTEETAPPRSRARRLTIRALVVLAVLALVVAVPGPVFRAIHANEARELVDHLSTGRAQLFAMQDEFRAPIAELGSPAQSWTQVSCWLSPRYSDGDGEQDVVMFYWQQCTLSAYEVYPLPQGSGDAAQVAARLGGSTAGEPGCAEVVFDVLTPDFGASAFDEYSAALWWFEPGGAPPPDQPHRCAMPSPDDPGITHVTRGVDEPMTAEAYLVYQVSSPTGAVGVGCDRHPVWVFSCAGEPRGFPVL